MLFRSDDDLFIANRGADEILRYDGSDGDFKGVFASGGGLDEPTHMVFVPEPTSALLLGLSATHLFLYRRRRAVASTV